MNILGVHGGFTTGVQDASACLLRDGVVLAAIQEERLSRVKFSPGRLPYLAISNVLKNSKIGIKEVDHVAFHGVTWGPDVKCKIEDFLISHFGYSPPISQYHHHDCHAASVYFASKFDEALIVTSDSSGDGVSMQISVGFGGEVNVLKKYSRPNSLGVFYSMLTQYCGFTKEADEYKLMGLAAYGRPDIDLSWLIEFKNGNLKLNTSYLKGFEPSKPSPHFQQMLFNEKLIERLGRPRRLPDAQIEQFYKDVAASAQLHFEIVLTDIVEHFIQYTGISDVCLAGGAAFNGVANSKLLATERGVRNLYVSPVSGDMGLSMGAAWLCSREFSVTPKAPSNYFLGHAYQEADILSTLEKSKVNFSRISNPAEIAANLIEKNMVIGWFQGKDEFGPRALGNRSILANPFNAKMKDIVNQKIKFRDGFRPFGASVIDLDVDKLFGSVNFSSYMNVTYKVKDEYADMLSSVTNVDQTSRIQNVERKDNPMFYDLLLLIREKFGFGVVLNTSFNLSHEPIVSSPRDALATFFSSGLDALIIGDYLVSKQG
ncbi:MAG: hypothetical protein H6603_08235 [Flavobacteriales bacterium]|nr:hypothetical protein [Flavobacteriales bacterium]